MLTPAKTDENRDDELKRRKAQPTEFGSAVPGALPKDWNSEKGGLKDIAPKPDPEPEKEPAEAKK